MARTGPAPHESLKTVVATPAPHTPPIAEPEIFIVGLKKIGPKRYSVVTGTVSNPVVDKTTDPLEYAAEAMKLAIHKLLQNIS